MQNAISMNIAQSTANEIITIKDIAKELGLCTTTVRRALSKSEYYQNMVSEKTKVRVREYAKVNGYDPNRAKSIRYGGKIGRSGKRGWAARSTSGNFASRQEETERMLYLRNKKAMTNPEIAEKVGVSNLSVLRRIGPTPKELLEMSYALRGERVARRNQARKNLLLDRKITRINLLQQEVDEQTRQTEQMEAEANRIMLEAQHLMDQAKQKRDNLNGKVIELNKYRKEASREAKTLGRILA